MNLHLPHPFALIRALAAIFCIALLSLSAGAQDFLGKDSSAEREAAMVWNGEIPGPISLAGAKIYYDYNRNRGKGERVGDLADGKLYHLRAIPVHRISETAFVFAQTGSEVMWIAIIPEIIKLFPQGISMNKDVDLIARYITDASSMMNGVRVFHVIWASDVPLSSSEKNK